MPPAATHRAQLLARMAGAAARSPGHDVVFAWSPTETHPADPLTYPSPDLTEVRRRLVAVTRGYIHRPQRIHIRL